VVTTNHEESDGLIPLGAMTLDKIMTATHSCCLCFGFVGIDMMVTTFKVLLWSFLCNFMDMNSG